MSGFYAIVNVFDCNCNICTALFSIQPFLQWNFTIK